MAFMNRGEVPSIEDEGKFSEVYPYFIGRFYTYIPLDNTYVLM